MIIQEIIKEQIKNKDVIDIQFDEWTYNRISFKEINGIKVSKNENLIKQKCKIITKDNEFVISLLGEKI